MSGQVLSPEAIAALVDAAREGRLPEEKPQPQRRRRMRAVGREMIDSGRSGEDVVVRALPGSAQLSWPELSGRIRAELTR